MNLLRKILYYFCAPCDPGKSATVRYAFPLVFTFAALLGAAAVISSGKSYIHIESSQQNLRAGETFQIGVYVNAHVPVNAVDISLTFPKEQIEVLGIETGESVITLWTRDPYVENNSVILQGGTFRRGFKGDHLIATINARATETGLAQVSVDDVILLAGDGSGTKVSVADNEDGSTTLYITEGDGKSIAAEDDYGVNLQGSVAIVIVTDIDGDGAVTISDISRFMLAWRNRSVVYDFNGDGTMTFRDFGIILADSFLR